MSISLVGLASNLDTATIINELMKIERIPYQKLQTQKSSLSSKQTMFRTINTKLRALENAAADLLLKGTYNPVKTSSSNENAVKITGSGNGSVGTYTVAVETLARANVLQSKAVNASDEDLKDTVFKLHYKGTTYEIKSTKTKNSEILEDIKDQINAKNTGVTASVIETVPGKKVLVLSAKETGTANSVEWGTGSTESDTKTFFEWSAMADTDFTTAVGAQDAKFTVNGVEISGRSSNTISDVIEGVTFQLLKENETSVITVERDYNAVAAKVEAFVNAYNDVIQTIREYTGKEAALQGNATLRNLSSQLNSLINQALPDGFDLRHLWEVGLEVDKGVTSASLMTGKISFDKNKFIEKLKENPEAVMTLFLRDSEKDSGIIRNFRDVLKKNWTDSIDGAIAREIAGFDASISMLNDRMERMEYQLQLKEEQLKKQFTAMELALANLQNQQMWIAAQLTSLMSVSGK